MSEKTENEKKIINEEEKEDSTILDDIIKFLLKIDYFKVSCIFLVF